MRILWVLSQTKERISKYADAGKFTEIQQQQNAQEIFFDFSLYCIGGVLCGYQHKKQSVKIVQTAFSQ